MHCRRCALACRACSARLRGHITQDLGIAGQAARGVVQGADDAQRPEPFAALAQVPALVLGAPLLARAAQLCLGQALRAVFGGEDECEGSEHESMGSVLASLPWFG
jgi:hypothetical protein